MTYDIAPYVGTDENGFDADDIRCRVTWTPRDGDTVTITGAFLTLWGKHPALACGLEEVAERLSLWDVIGDHSVGVCDLVDAQLVERPWAVIKCPAGTARLELVHAR